MQKVYAIFDIYDNANTGIAFAERTDAEEFVLACAEEGDFQWFCDYLFDDYWAGLNTAEDVLNKWKEYKDNDNKKDMLLSCYSLMCVSAYNIDEVEVF